MASSAQPPGGKPITTGAQTLTAGEKARVLENLGAASTGTTTITYASLTTATIGTATITGCTITNGTITLLTTNKILTTSLAVRDAADENDGDITVNNITAAACTTGTLAATELKVGVGTWLGVVLKNSGAVDFGTINANSEVSVTLAIDPVATTAVVIDSAIVVGCFTTALPAGIIHKQTYLSDTSTATFICANVTGGNIVVGSVTASVLTIDIP